MFICNEFYDYCNKGDNIYDGVLLSFLSNEERFSYLALNQNNLVCRTVEKQVISEHAICGVYYFKNKSIFEQAAEVYLKKCDYKEFYISGVYNIMADNNALIKYFDVDMHESFGTPEEYELAKNSKYFEDLE